MKITDKLRKIREQECSGRPEFEKLTGIPIGTIIRYENKKQTPRYEVIEKVMKLWPEYTMWLIHGETNAESGQISPDIKRENLQIGNQKEVS